MPSSVPIDYSFQGDGILSVKTAMERDFQALKELSTYEKPLLRVWQYERPSITYGYFTPIDKLLTDEAYCHFDIAKRPTGGGILFHMGDCCFSFAVPASSSWYSESIEENYARINNWLLDRLGMGSGGEKPSQTSAREYCQANSTKYDVIYCGKKIAGCAERKTKSGFLHQCALFLEEPDWTLIERALYNGKEVVALMKEQLNFIKGDIIWQ